MNNEEIRTLDLFAGIGGFSYALERLCPAGAFRTVAFCEQDRFAQRVLRKHWPDTPIYNDVRTIPTDGLGRIDLICGGFPCQPWSVAGQQRGAEDDRDLWPEMVRLVEELRPNWLIGENVRGFVNEPLGLRRSLSDLESIGYEAVPFIIPACAVDAPHRRDRVWIVANAQRERGPGRMLHAENELQASTRRAADTFSTGSTRSKIVADAKSNDHFKQSGAADGKWKNVSRRSTEVRFKPRRCGEGVADADRASSQGRRLPGRIHAEHAITNSGSDEIGRQASLKWLAEPDVGRVANGVPNRVDRLKCLGNAVVPQVVEQIGRAILEGWQR
jgi:DNA (cytosine-5)-methyltransferase 1